MSGPRTTEELKQAPDLKKSFETVQFFHFQLNQDVRNYAFKNDIFKKLFLERHPHPFTKEEMDLIIFRMADILEKTIALNSHRKPILLNAFSRNHSPASIKDFLTIIKSHVVLTPRNLIDMLCVIDLYFKNSPRDFLHYQNIYTLVYAALIISPGSERHNQRRLFQLSPVLPKDISCDQLIRLHGNLRSICGKGFGSIAAAGVGFAEHHINQLLIILDNCLGLPAIVLPSHAVRMLHPQKRKRRNSCPGILEQLLSQQQASDPFVLERLTNSRNLVLPFSVDRKPIIPPLEGPRARLLQKVAVILTNEILLGEQQRRPIDKTSCFYNPADKFSGGDKYTEIIFKFLEPIMIQMHDNPLSAFVMLLVNLDNYFLEVETDSLCYQNAARLLTTAYVVSQKTEEDAPFDNRSCAMLVNTPKWILKICEQEFLRRVKFKIHMHAVCPRDFQIMYDRMGKALSDRQIGLPKSALINGDEFARLRALSVFSDRALEEKDRGSDKAKEKMQERDGSKKLNSSIRRNSI